MELIVTKGSIKWYCMVWYCMYSFDRTQPNMVTEGSYVFLWKNKVRHCHWWKSCIPLIKHSLTLSLMEVMYCLIEQTNTVTGGSYLFIWYIRVQHCHWWKLCIPLTKHSPTMSLMEVMYSFDRTQSNTVTGGGYALFDKAQSNTVTDESYMFLW